MLFTRCANVLAIGVPVVCCASYAGVQTRSGAPTVVVAASTVLTADGLGRVVQQGSLIDRAARGRPSFILRSRRATALVSVDGSALTGLSILRTIEASAVREVRLHRASSGVVQPAIG